MSDLYDIFGEELVSTTEQMIKICFVLSSDIDVLSRERSFDGGDYTLEVNTQCRVYCNKCDEITDEEIIALRKFAPNFEEVETVETTWGETNWYDKSGTIVSEKKCSNLLLELNKISKRFIYVNDYMSLQDLPLITRKEEATSERQIQKNILQTI